MAALPRPSPPTVLAVLLTTALGLLAVSSSWTIGPRTFAEQARWLALGALACVGCGAAALGVVRRTGRRPGIATLSAGALVLLALSSALWSIQEATSARHALALGLLVAAAGGSALASRTRDSAAHIVWGLVGGGFVVVALSAGALIVARDRAIADADRFTPARFQGIGENPNTAALLLALIVPAALWLTATGRGARRAAAAAGLFVLVVEVFASGARGAILGGLAGSMITAALWPAARRRRAVAIAALLLLVVVGTLAAAQLKPNPRAPVKPSDVEVAKHLPKNEALGGIVPRPGTFLTGSGRLEGWRAAVRIGDRRPVAGHGFATEPTLIAAYAAIHPFESFESSYAENSFLALYLDLGMLGLTVLGIVLAAIAAAAVRALRLATEPAERALVAALVGIVVAGLVQAVFQSYLLRAGSIAALAFWTAALLLADTPGRLKRAGG